MGRGEPIGSFVVNRNRDLKSKEDKIDLRSRFRVTTEEEGRNTRKPASILPPFVNRDTFPVFATHDSPVAVRFSAYHDDFYLILREYPDVFGVRGFEHRGIGLDSLESPWVNVILDELIIPINAGWHCGVFVHPIDQLVFGVKPAAVDKLSRGDGIEDESRGDCAGSCRRAGYARARARIFPAAPNEMTCGPTAREGADDAIIFLKTMLFVKRHPGTSVLILRERYAIVSVVIALRSKVGHLRQGTPLKILREETVGATDSGVGVVVRPHGSDTPIHADLMADRAVDDSHARR